MFPGLEMHPDWAYLAVENPEWADGQDGREGRVRAVEFVQFDDGDEELRRDRLFMPSQPYYPFMADLVKAVAAVNEGRINRR